MVAEDVEDIGADNRDELKLKGKLSDETVGNAKVLTKEGTTFSLPMLGGCSEAGN